MVGVPVNERAALDHVVQFYEFEDELTEAVAAFLVEGLAQDEAVLAVATRPHRDAFEARLAAAGIDVGEAMAAGNLVFFDARQLLDQLLDGGGHPDGGRFGEVVGGYMRDLVAGGRRVRAFGEMVALLWEAGAVSAAIDLEDHWNRLAQEVDFSLLCAYPVSAGEATEREAFEQVCRQHARVVKAPGAGRSSSLGGDRAASQAFAGDGRGVRAARHFAVQTATGWGHGPLTDDIALVVTELVTNAVLHGRSDFTLALSLGPRGLRVEVGDAAAAVPQLRRPEHDETSGRGVQIVDRLSARWGADVVGSGKVVWAELAI